MFLRLLAGQWGIFVWALHNHTNILLTVISNLLELCYGCYQGLNSLWFFILHRINFYCTSWNELFMMCNFITFLILHIHYLICKPLKQKLGKNNQNQHTATSIKLAQSTLILHNKICPISSRIILLLLKFRCNNFPYL